MKAVIFAGGKGSRLSEETIYKPKPLVEIGGKPIIFHLMEIYASQGVKDFLILLGYRQEQVKLWFSNFLDTLNDYQLDLETGHKEYTTKYKYDWKISFLDTGLDTNTAGRLAKAKNILESERFFLNYCDGLGNVNLEKLQNAHEKNSNVVTLTSVDLPPKFGFLTRDGNQVISLREKPTIAGLEVNSGFFVVEPEIFKYLEGESVVDDSWEEGPLMKLCNERRLGVYNHEGYWKTMNSLKEKESLEADIQLGSNPPWLMIE